MLLCISKSVPETSPTFAEISTFFGSGSPPNKTWTSSKVLPLVSGNANQQNTPPRAHISAYIKKLPCIVIALFKDKKVMETNVPTILFTITATLIPGPRSLKGKISDA
ncbi:hypothetical protein AMTR_s00059p00125600 [Amborella trichopoda]|uniref:Uncharacterized protein n=1 Tax=Amborella trichopoda TaxID=13333 RepID=U5D5R9_AMBTC|nr:hypothetical protein AMTR_s00059p00125600 [Amborella trichopoda]